jgi:arsenate reductase-like glutaredoxin family protein
MRTSSYSSSSSSWEIYGTEGCGWCKKQKAYMNAKGIKYNFIDCSSGSCGSDITSFPTLKNMETGEIKVGYNEV